MIKGEAIAQHDVVECIQVQAKVGVIEVSFLHLHNVLQMQCLFLERNPFEQIAYRPAQVISLIVGFRAQYERDLEVGEIKKIDSLEYFSMNVS